MPSSVIKPLSRFQAIGTRFLFFFLTLATSFAETSLGELNLVVRRWGIDQGRLGLASNALAQTPDGSLWVGNHNGLHQLKGHQVTHFETAQIPEVGNRNVNRLCVDPKGHLWLTTPQNSIATFRRGEFFRARFPENIGNITCWCPHAGKGVVVCFNQGNTCRILWITRDQCLTLHEGETLLPRAIHMDAEDRLWLATRQGTIIEIDHGNANHLPPSQINGVGGFLTRRDGSLLAFGSNGTYLHRGDDWERHLQFSAAIPSRHPATHCTEDHHGRLWLSAERSGLWLCQADGTLEKITAGLNSMPGTIGQLMTDSDGNLWAATFSGLYQARYSPFFTWSVPMTLTAPHVLMVKSDRQGDLWFTSFGGISRLSPGKDQPELIIPRPIVEVTQFAPEHSRSVWFGNKDKEFFHWNGTDIIRVSLPDFPHSLVPTGMEVGHDGKVWLTSYAGVFLCDPQQTPLAFKKISGTGGLPDISYQHVHLGQDHTVFLVSRGKGIFHRKKHTSGWSSLYQGDLKILSRGGPIAPDRGDRVWYLAPKFPNEIGAQGTIGLITRSDHYSIALRDLGLRTRLATGIAIDDQNGLWIQTISEGIHHLDQVELLKRFRDPSVNPTITRFGLPDGLRSLGGTFTQHGLEFGSDGRLWAATQGGLSSISPKEWLEEKKRVSAPSLFFDRLRIDNQATTLSSSRLVVPPGASSFEIAFDSLSFEFPSEIHFKHRLLGTSGDWREIDDLRKITYQKLPPGDYQFEVKSTDRFGAWSNQSLTLPITVLPYWWERRSVQSAALVFVAAILAWMVHLRLRSLRKRSALQDDFSRQLISSQEKERKRIAGELHDSLGQSLLVVKNLAVLGERQKAPSPGLYPEIAECVGEALDQIRSISRDLRPPELDHLGITKALIATIARVQNSTAINFTSHVDELSKLLSTEQEICLYRILQESLSNILKHAKARQVTILVSQKQQSVDLMIEDDGCGFDQIRCDQKGIGLGNMRDRARLAGGTFTLDSRPGEGTRSRLSLPLRVSPPQNT